MTDSKTEKALEPCPFCGGSAKYQDLSGAYIGHNHVVCTQCKATTYDDDKTDARVKWNARAIHVRSLPGQVREVAITPLEWISYQDSEGSAPRWKTEHPFGEYRVIYNRRDGEFWSPELGGVGISWDTLEAAKASAQADYDHRIRSALALPLPEDMKLEITKEWFEKRVAAEGDLDPTTGRPSTRKTMTLNLTDEEIAELERLANPNRDAIRAEAFEEAAAVAYRVCAETRHVQLGDKAAAAIRAISPSPEGSSDE